MEDAKSTTLFRLNSREAQEYLDCYRAQWENDYGPTDLSIQYTSQAPAEVQDWLLAHRPQLYFQGLPPFLQGFYAAFVREALAEGNLDALPSAVLRLFVLNHGRMNPAG